MLLTASCVAPRRTNEQKSTQAVNPYVGSRSSYHSERCAVYRSSVYASIGLESSSVNWLWVSIVIAYPHPVQGGERMSKRVRPLSEVKKTMLPEPKSRADLEAENARLQARVEEAEAWEGERDSYIKEFDKTCKERDGYKARDKLRGEALGLWFALKSHLETCQLCLVVPTICWEGMRLEYEAVSRSRAAIDISPEEAREREARP